MFPADVSSDWLEKNVKNDNEEAQRRAAFDLAKYNNELLPGWAQSTIQARYNNAPIPKPPAPPMITQFYIEDGVIKDRVVINPGARPPILPPMPPVTGPNVGIVGTSGSGAAAFSDEVIKLLRENNAMLKTLSGQPSASAKGSKRTK